MSLTIPGGLDEQSLCSCSLDDLLKHDSFLVRLRQYRLGTPEGTLPYHTRAVHQHGS